METLTLEIGNSSWWKNKKYRKEAVKRLRELRKNNLSVKLVKKYKLNASNTIVYGDYLVTNKNL
jgi:hypothetical protein